MSLFHSQTIFNILITLIICSAMFIFFRFKLRVLEVSQREQAKVLQSLVMSMRNGGHQRNAVSEDEIMKHVQLQMQMQQGGAGAGAGANAGGPSNQNRHPNDLIDVSDDDDDDDDESESSSDSEDDDTDSSSSEEENDENDENHENTTKKIIFNNGGALDTHAHPIEHLTGDDIKVIELTEPLYAVGAGSKHDNGNNVSDDDEQEDDNEDDDNEDMSDDDNDNDNDDEETSDDTEVKVQELPSHEQHLETSIIDTTEIKTIFKANKQQQQQQQHSDYNSMNVQALKQHLKTKLSAEGMHYNETAINKLNKKELIKHLTQG